MSGPSRISGIVIADGQGRVTYSVGLGRHPGIATLVGQPEWCADAIKRRLVAVDIDKQKLALVWVSISRCCGGYLQSHL